MLSSTVFGVLRRALGPLLIALLLLVALPFMAPPAGADTTPNPVVTLATTPTQSNVVPQGPLTNLRNGDVITFNLSGTTIFGADIRLCRAGTDVQFQSQFNPSPTGNCLANPLPGGGSGFVSKSFSPTNTGGTVQWTVGTGSDAATPGGHVGAGAPIVCDSTSPCVFWIKESVPTSVVPGGIAWVSYNATFAPTGTLTVLPAFVPTADQHKVDLLVDGQVWGQGLGNLQTYGPRPLSVGNHTLTYQGSGDTDVARYYSAYFGNCSSGGVITVTAGGTFTCAVILVHGQIPVPNLTVSDVSIVRPSSGAANAVFTVSLNGPSFFPVSVNYATANGTATAPTDYTSASGTLSFGAGVTSQTVSVPITSTAFRGVSTSFNLNLSSPSAASISDGTGVATLINRQGPFSVSVQDLDVVRSTTANTTANATVKLSNAPAAGESVTVNLATSNGTATSPTDYNALASTPVTFAAGETTKTVAVTVKPQPLATATRTFNLNLTSPSANAVIADATGLATLRSSGSTAPLPSLAVNDVSVLRPGTGSNNATFTVTLSQVAASNVTVAYTTANGSAVAPGDYTTVSGSLTFTPGQVSKTVVVPVNATTRRALNHAFTLVLSAPSGAVLGDSSGSALLINTRGRYVATILDNAIVRSAGLDTTGQITISLNAPVAAGDSVSVSVVSANGTAVAGTDYTAVPGTVVTFAPGEQSKTIALTALAKPAGTAIRTLTLALSSPSTNAQLADVSALISLIGP